MTRSEKSGEAPGSSPWQRAGTLGLLTICYTLGELGHFLIATTSKQVRILTCDWIILVT